MNKFKRVAIGLAVTGAMAFSSAASAELYNASVDWAATQDIGGAPISNGILAGGNYILNSTLDDSGNDTGYRVHFSTAAHSTNQVTLDGLLGPAGLGQAWQYVNTEWRGGSGATAHGFATNNTGVTQTMTEIAAETTAQIGFGAGFNPGTELANAVSLALGSFDGGTALPVDLTAAPNIGSQYDLAANPFLDDLGPAWVVNPNETDAYARGWANNSQAGSGNVDFTVSNRAYFYAEARHNYVRVPVGVPESGALAMVGLGLSLVGFQSVARKRKQA